MMHCRTPHRVVVWALLGMLCLLAWPTAATAQPLANKLQTLIRSSPLGASKVGVAIMDPESGQVLAAHNGGEAFIPASNMKVLTSGAALAVLGPGFQFRTDLVIQPEAGNRVVVRGSGDPAFGDPELLSQMKMSVEDLLNVWVKTVKDTTSSPPGELVIDDRIFDRELVHPSWPAAQLNRRYCAEVSGLNFHVNTIAIYARPGAVGSAPTLSVSPRAPWIEVRNRARSVDKGQQTAWVARAPDSNSMTFNGDVRYANDPVRVSIHNSPDFFARLLSDRLASAGLRPLNTRLADPSEDLSGGQVLHSIVTDLPTVLDRCNKDSYNLYAEAMIKRIGHDVTGAAGSWRSGGTVLRMVVNQRLGEGAARDLVVADGSGMSRENRVTPLLLTKWLSSFHTDAANREIFRNSLPLGGEEGTLDSRFRSNRVTHEVRAKSGYLSGVTGLTGYITHRETGRTVAFSILVNDKPNNVATRTVRDFEEKVVQLADQWLTESAGAAGRR